MKVIKNKYLRMFLYVLGYASAFLAVFATVIALIKYESYLDADKDKPFCETSYVKNAINDTITEYQQNAVRKKTLIDTDFSKETVDVYSCDGEAPKKQSVSEILGDRDEVDALQDYENALIESNDPYNNYHPFNNRLSTGAVVKMTYTQYENVLNELTTLIPYNGEYLVYMDKMNGDAYEDELDPIEFTDDNQTSLNESQANLDNTSSSESVEQKRLKYLLINQFLNDFGMPQREGDRAALINSNLVLYSPNNYIYINGTVLTIDNYKSEDYIYIELPKKYQNDSKYISNGYFDYTKLGSDILLGNVYTNDDNLAYVVISDETKRLLNSYKSSHTNSYVGANFLYSFKDRGNVVDYRLIGDTSNMGDNGRVLLTTDDISFQDAFFVLQDASDVFVRYNADTDRVEQWYKQKNGEFVVFEYLDENDIERIKKISDDSFAIGISVYNTDSSNFVSYFHHSLLNTFDYPILVAIVSVILFLLVVVLLTIGEPVKMYAVDHVPYLGWDFLYMNIFIGACATFRIVMQTSQFLYKAITDGVTFYVICGAYGLVLYATTASLYMNVVRRIKCKKFWDGFITIKMIKWITKKVKSIVSTFSGNKKILTLATVTVIVNIVGFIIILGAFLDGNEFLAAFGIILLLAIVLYDVFVVYKFSRFVAEVNKVLSVSKQIEAGDLDAKVDTESLTFVAKDLGESLNNLGTGLSMAVESSVRDERTKAELITNVSHDIKTPLTSIINYVDLLKREDIQNEKAIEYIDVLDKKSQRLKQLLLDLIEASKTSTGNIELECMDINFVELINQCLGENEEKLSAANLDIVKEFDTDSAIIHADGRRVFRIIDNILGNVAKYTQPNTRVYVNLRSAEGKVCFSVKNVSREMLNISAEELTERFVRGDKSRYTEGSGLGLSIAKSLTELHGGTFKVTIDGDLFKVFVTLPCK